MKLKILKTLAFIIFFTYGSLFCHSKTEPQTLDLKLLFEKTSDRSEGALSTPRDFTMDKEKNIYTFDYINNRIFKFNQKGTQLAVFGKMGKGKNESRHLINVMIVKDNLIAIDSVAMFTYSLEGKLLKREPFEQEALLEFPILLKNKHFLGEKVLSDELKNVLTMRDKSGKELFRLASYDLKKYFPRLNKGEDFFLNNTYAPQYHYDTLSDGSIVWVRSDQPVIYQYRNKNSIKQITINDSPEPFPEDEQKKMNRKKDAMAKNMPLLHMFVPTFYPIVQKLFTGSNNTWAYIVTKNRTGFFQYNKKGKEIGFYTTDKNLNMLKARIHIFHGSIYIMVSGRGNLKIYAAPIPK